MNTIQILIAFFIVAFGQPGISTLSSILAGSIGYALFFYKLLDVPSKSRRFTLGFGFFFGVQLVQLYWLTSHPFLYIWIVYFALSALMGAQFALVCLFVTRKILSSWICLLFIPSLWTCLEWTREYWLSGFYFNLAGYTLTATIYGLQNASLFGIYGLTFYALFTNIAFTKAFSEKRLKILALATLLAFLPYAYGMVQYDRNEEQKHCYDKEHTKINALICHSARPPGELEKNIFALKSPEKGAFVQWEAIFKALSPYRNKLYDMILIQEIAVPFSSITPMFPANDANVLFSKYFDVKQPLFSDIVTSQEIAQALSIALKSPLIIGLEGSTWNPSLDKIEYSNSAFLFTPEAHPPKRYDKRILVPMGEYIPFEWIKTLTRNYGIVDSFQPGKEAILFRLGRYKAGMSICYEETSGRIMLENKKKGANLLINLTDDYWYPYSDLAKQHFMHARPKTVESGLPLLRACNFGVSAAVDSIGNIVLYEKGTKTLEASEVALSSYTYNTLYSLIGDTPILILIGITACISGFLIIFRRPMFEQV